MFKQKVIILIVIVLIILKSTEKMVKCNRPLVRVEAMPYLLFKRNENRLKYSVFNGLYCCLTT